MTTTLVGKGKGMLKFGNCWKKGVVKVYLDGSEIESAGPGEFKVVSFDYNNGLELKISELNTAIIQIDKFELGKLMVLKSLKSFDEIVKFLFNRNLACLKHFK